MGDLKKSMTIICFYVLKSVEISIVVVVDDDVAVNEPRL